MRPADVSRMRRILAVDDERLSRQILCDCLEACGYQAVPAASGPEALEKLEADAEIALVITDWVMPGMEGPELCRRIRSLAGDRYLPVLLLTGLDSGAHLAAGLDAGADAFLSKPLEPGALLAQIRVAERILSLEENLAARVRNLEDANERIRRDLDAAAAVQKSHLPSEAPVLPSADFAWVYDASETLGGDMFNVFRLDEDHVGLYVLDVSGHGTSAALLSVSLSRALVPFPQQGGLLKRTMSVAPYYEIVPPAEVAEELNRRFQLIEQSGHFCTFLYGILQLSTRRFRYVSAGHPGPMLVGMRPAHSHDEGGGVPIGVLEEASYSDVEIELEADSQLILYTDGLNERSNEAGEEFGTNRILGLLSARAPVGGIEAAVRALFAGVEEFGKGQRKRDDITILGVGVT